MAKCEHVFEDGRRCGAHSLTPVEAPDDTGQFCWSHSQDPDVIIKRGRSRRRGGRSSRKIEPADIPELTALLEEMERGETDDLLATKKLCLASMRSLLDGGLTPTQFRAMTGGMRTLRDILQLEMYRELVDRVTALEGHSELELLGADTWRISTSEPFPDE